jgi:hypothetical protein
MLTVSRADVKRKLRLTTNDYDAEIDALIAEMLPALRYAIEPSSLSTSDADLLATLNLGALEVIAGEMGATLYRELGAWTGFRIGWLQVQPPALRDPADPTGLIPIARAEFTIAPLRRFPPLREGNRTRVRFPLLAGGTLRRGSSTAVFVNSGSAMGIKTQGYARLKPFLRREAQLLFVYREREEETP